MQAFSPIFYAPWRRREVTFEVWGTRVMTRHRVTKIPLYGTVSRMPDFGIEASNCIDSPNCQVGSAMIVIVSFTMKTPSRLSPLACPSGGQRLRRRAHVCHKKPAAHNTESTNASCKSPKQGRDIPKQGSDPTSQPTYSLSLLWVQRPIHTRHSARIICQRMRHP